MSHSASPLLSFGDELDQDLPARLELLEELAWEWIGDETPLAGVRVLQIQHQLAQQVSQTEMLLRLGVQPDDLYWIDLPYSANQNVVGAMRDAGIPETNLDRCGFGVLETYALRQLERVQRWVRHLAEQSPAPLLVLDDGAYVLEALSCFDFAWVRERFAGLCIVEQTTRGIIKMERNAAMWRLGRIFPVVDVARSDTKNSLESPYVGICVCAALSRRLGAQLAEISRAGRCLVLGYGDIGRSVARHLVASCGFAPERVHVCDLDDQKKLEAAAEGHPLWQREQRDFDTRFDLVVGCSGRDSFALGDYVFLEDGAFLVSASSGTVELSRRDFIEWAAATDFDDVYIRDRETVESRADHHADLEFVLADRSATFVNAGYPVNFDGRVRIIPDRYIQTTQCLMIAAAIQAVEALESGERGILEVEPSRSTRIRDRFLSLLRELGDPFPGTVSARTSPR